MQTSLAEREVRVFIVEDNRLDLEGLQSRLKFKGFQYVGAHDQNDEQMLEKIKASMADVILVDLTLYPGLLPSNIRRKPRYDGLAAIAAIRAEFGTTKRILCLSQWEELFKDARDAGA